MRSLTIRAVQMKESEMGRACSPHGINNKLVLNLSLKPEGKRLFSISKRKQHDIKMHVKDTCLGDVRQLPEGSFEQRNG
jgi:hypothetical protein